MSKKGNKSTRSHKSESAVEDGNGVSSVSATALAALQVNLSAIKRADSRAAEIIHTSSFTVVYRLQLATKQWERANIEGTLFLYRAKANNTPSNKPIAKLVCFNL